MYDDDDSVLDAFRARLRDGLILASYHGRQGEPVRGVLELQDDKVTLTWRCTERFAIWKRRSAQIRLCDVCCVREGRQTSTLIRTIKYVAPDELPRNDECCLSLCRRVQPPSRSTQRGGSGSGANANATASTNTNTNANANINANANFNANANTNITNIHGNHETMSSRLVSFDIEFEDASTRNVAMSFFLAETNLIGAIDLYTDADDMPLPSGWSTLCFQLTTHPTFDLVILVLVLINVIVLATGVVSGADDDGVTAVRMATPTPSLVALEGVVLVVLTLEQCLKVIALEGVRPVLRRRRWDAFDFALVIISWLALVPYSPLEGINLLTLRLLRGVRLFKHWRGFHEVVETFLAALPMAGNAVLCYCYYLFLFAILGMYLFNDALGHRCATKISGITEYVASHPTQFCQLPSASASAMSSGALSASCRGSSLSCVAMPAPHHGFTGFHSFESSFLTVFLVSQRAGFGPALDGARASSSATSSLALLYFISITVFVSYILLSLFVGIVRGAFITATKDRDTQEQEQARHQQEYEKLGRVPFPSATHRVPDLLALLAARWRGSRMRVRDSVLHSRLFAPNELEYPYARRSSRVCLHMRLHRDRVFYVLRRDGVVRRFLRAIADAPWFEHGMNLAVFANSLLFAMEYHGMSTAYAAILYAAEHFLIVLYAIEFLVVCTAAGGLVKYLKNPWNRLDFAVLSCAALEFAIVLVRNLDDSHTWRPADTSSRAIFVLRLFRLVRPFRVIRKKNALLAVLDAILASLPAFMSVTAFYMLLVSLFAVVGMHLYGGRFPSANVSAHYDTFGDSLLTLFKIACGGEIWSVVLASHAARRSLAITLLFYLGYFVLAGAVTLNVILVVLLRAFAMNGDAKKTALSNLFQDRLLRMQRVHHFDEATFLQCFSELYRDDTMYATLSGAAAKRARIGHHTAEEMRFRLLKILPIADFLKIKGYSSSSTTSSSSPFQALPLSSPPSHSPTISFLASTVRSGSPNSRRKRANGVNIRYSRLEDNRGNDDMPDTETERGTETGTEMDEDHVALVPSRRSCRERIRAFFSGAWLTSDVSLFLFPRHSPFRLKCKRLEKETDKFIFTCIVTRTLLLTLQSPLYGDSIQEFTTLTEILFVLVLAFEFSIKVVSRGFLFTPHSYLSNPGNQINMAVMLACSLLLLLPHSTMVTIFRLGRAFGPVRVFYRVKMFRVISDALIMSAKPIGYCVVIMLFLFYSFATLGMQLFAGLFASCNDPAIDIQSACHGFFWTSLRLHEGYTPMAMRVLKPRVWGNHAGGMHFDHIGGAIRAVVVLVSKKGWLPVLNLAHHAMVYTSNGNDDGTGDGDTTASSLSSSLSQSRFGHAFLALFFFVGVMFVTRFYMLQVFAGIVMNNFRCHNGTLLLSSPQLIWMRAKMRVLKLAPQYPRSQHPRVQYAQLFVRTRGFRMFTSGVVVLHTVLLAWYRSPVGRSVEHALQGTNTDGIINNDEDGGGVWWLHYVFSLIYAVDAVMCIVSVGWKDFLLKGFTWRTANTVTAFIMLVGPMLSDSPVLLVLGMTRAFDFKHIALVLERFPSLRTLFETLHASVPVTLKVTLLLAYVLFIFATFGMQLFSLTRWHFGMNASLNYFTFPNAFATVVTFTAGEDWFNTDRACSVTSPQCVTSVRRHASDCGASFLSAVFYHTFYVLVVLVLQNLYVATMVDTYVSTSAVSGDNKAAAQQLLGFGTEDLTRFQQVWSEFDTDALGYMHRSHLLRFLTRLEKPLGLGSHHDMLTDVAVRLSNEQSGSGGYKGNQAHIRAAAIEHDLRRQRVAAFQDIDARLAEFVLRLRIIHDDHLGADFSCPTSMIRFADLVVVLTMRILPLESLTVPEKVDELAVRRYVERHRRALKIQSIFRMYRVIRHRRRRQSVRPRNEMRLTITGDARGEAGDEGNQSPKSPAAFVSVSPLPSQFLSDDDGQGTIVDTTRTEMSTISL